MAPTGRSFPPAAGRRSPWPRWPGRWTRRGPVLAVYQEPLKDAWQLFVILPLAKVKPTPYQRDLSKPHVARLQEVMKKIGRFVDPIVVVSTGPGNYWTPNGNHRREALTRLKADSIPAILIPEPEVAYQILALNTEKAHNVKEKSLEVIRMYRGLVEEGSQATEEDFAFQFEAPHFITLGLLYDARPRFAGGAFAPLLRRVDKFLKSPLPKAYTERERRAGCPGRGRRPGRRGGPDQEARVHSSLRQELRPGPDDAAHPGPEDAPLVRPDLRAAPEQPRSFRPGEGPPGRDRPRRRLRGPGLGAAALPGRARSGPSVQGETTSLGAPTGGRGAGYPGQGPNRSPERSVQPGRRRFQRRGGTIMAERAVRAALVAGVLLLLTACVVEQPVVVQRPPPPPPPVQAEIAPVAPGPAYVWVPGYWGWHGPRRGYVWVPGAYAVPPSQPTSGWRATGRSVRAAGSGSRGTGARGRLAGS